MIISENDRSKIINLSNEIKNVPKEKLLLELDEIIKDSIAFIIADYKVLKTIENEKLEWIDKLFKLKALLDK